MAEAWTEKGDGNGYPDTSGHEMENSGGFVINPDKDTDVCKHNFAPSANCPVCKNEALRAAKPQAVVEVLDAEPEAIHVWHRGMLPGMLYIRTCPGDEHHSGHFEKIDGDMWHVTPI